MQRSEPSSVVASLFLDHPVCWLHGVSFLRLHPSISDVSLKCRHGNEPESVSAARYDSVSLMNVHRRRELSRSKKQTDVDDAKLDFAHIEYHRISSLIFHCVAPFNKVNGKVHLRFVEVGKDIERWSWPRSKCRIFARKQKRNIQ